MTDEQKRQQIKALYPSQDVLNEALATAKAGEKEFISNDGKNYVVPDFLITDVEKTQAKSKPPVDPKTKPWYYDDDNNVDLSNYSDDTRKPMKGENVPQEEDLVFEDQINNEPLIDSLRRRHGNQKSNEELIDLWAAEQHFINYNVTALAYDAATLQNLTRQEKKDYLLQMETWDKVKAFGEGSQSLIDQSLEIGKALASDVTTYVGLSTFGVGFAAKEGAKATTKQAVKSYLKDSTKEAIKTGAKIGAIEGAIYGGVDETLSQVVEQKALEQEEIDLELDKVAGASAVGAAVGGPLGGALSGAVSSFVNRNIDGTPQTGVTTETEQIPDKESLIEAQSPQEVIQEESIELQGLAPKTEEQAAKADVEAQEAPGTISEAEYERLPKNLRNAKGFYKNTQIIFNNDVEKSVYIAGNTKKPSEHYNEFVTFAMNELGMERQAVIDLGKYMRAQIGQEIARRPEESSEPLSMVFNYIPETKKVRTTETITPKTVIDVDGEVIEADVERAAEFADEVAQEVGIDIDEATKLANEVGLIPDDAPTTPTEGAAINFENTQVYDLETSQAIIENYKVTSGVAVNEATETAARKKLLSFKTKDELNNFLKDFDKRTEDLHIDATVVRMIYSSEANKVAKAWSEAKTSRERLTVLINQPQLLTSLKTVSTMVQKTSTMAGRVLQAQKINVKEVNNVIDTIIDSTDKVKEIVDEAMAKGADEVEITEETVAALSQEELKELMDNLEKFVKITADHNDHVRRGLPAHNKNENIFRKVERALTEIWLSGNLYNTATQTGAIVGSFFKRGTMKGESYLTWSIGKAFGNEDRMKFNELKALNEADFMASVESLKMLRRMFKGGTNEGPEGILQRESLDGFNTKWDDETTHGAINSDYLGFQDPNTLFKSLVNNSIDTAGVVTRGSFTALTLVDDIMKRAYYLPHIKYQATKQANAMFPNDPTAHALHITKTVEAYRLYYSKKGQRTNTMKIAFVGEMEKFNKENPNATYDEIQEAEFNAEAKAEELVQFTEDEKILLEEVGIDDIVHEKSMQFLREMLFQTDIPTDRTSITGKILGGVTAVRDVTPLMQTQLPYLKTIFNMTKDTLQRLPVVGALSRDLRADLAAGGERRHNAVAKQVMGLTLLGVGKHLYENGFITPTTDMEDYQTEQATGLAGGMLRVPFTDWIIPLNRIDPIGSFFLLMADFLKLTEEKVRLDNIVSNVEYNELVEKDSKLLEEMEKDMTLIIGTLAVQLFSEKSGAKGVRDLINVLENPTSDAAEQYFYRYVTGFIPGHSGIRQIAEGDESYEAKTFLENARKKLGIMGEYYGDRDNIDFFGEKNNDIYRLGGVHWRTSQPKKNDPVAAKLYELQPGFRKMDNKFSLGNGVVVDLDYKDTYELNTYMAKPIHKDPTTGMKVSAKELLKNFINTDEFKNLPKGSAEDEVSPFPTQVKALKNVYKKLQTSAKAAYYEDNEKSMKKKYASTIQVLGTQVLEENKQAEDNAKMFKNFLGEE